MTTEQLEQQRLREMEERARRVLGYVCAACKPLLWLRDADSALPLAHDVLKPLRDALDAVRWFPNAKAALCAKLIKNFDRALHKKAVSVTFQPRSTRLGRRAAQDGVLAALNYARERRNEFAGRAEHACNAPGLNWGSLFELAEKFIDDLDWREAIIENPRGQAASLVLEAVELVNEKAGSERFAQELGDVFFNLLASCLSLKVLPEHLFKTLDFYHGDPAFSQSLAIDADGSFVAQTWSDDEKVWHKWGMMEAAQVAKLLERTSAVLTDFERTTPASPDIQPRKTPWLAHTFDATWPAWGSAVFSSAVVSIVQNGRRTVAVCGDEPDSTFDPLISELVNVCCDLTKDCTPEDYSLSPELFGGPAAVRQ